MKIKQLSYYFLFLLFLNFNIEASERHSVKHYMEANISNNYIFTDGSRLGNKQYFATGWHIAHGSNITPVHALVMSYGKDYFRKDDAVLTAATFFLRRYMPKYSTSDLLFYSTIGSAYYRYEKPNILGSLENAGIIIGWGADWAYSKKLRLSIETDYRGFNIGQFGSESADYIRPVTLFLGFKYYYLTTHYLE